MKRWLLAALLLACAAAAPAARLCVQAPERSSAESDRILQVAALIEQRLAGQGQAALVARAGTNLRRFGIRYTHAALALERNPLQPWALRQLYFDCDSRRPQLFDQGLAAFLMGADARDRGFVSVLLLPAEAAHSLAAVALDRPQALALLSADYLANAHPEDTERQNCNQWLLELMAVAWGGAEASRSAAQSWLREQRFRTEPIHYRHAFWRVGTWFVPWVSMRGQPAEDLAANRLHTALPTDLERLAVKLWPQAQRLQLCFTPTHALLRRGDAPLDEACEGEPGDERLPL